MSEQLKNREYKYEILKKLIRDLHNGRDFNEVKKEFNEFVEGVDAVEIANMEQQLMEEGMAAEEIKELCDVHAAVFREAVEKNAVELVPGHPLYNLKHENAEAKRALEEMENLVKELSAGDQEKALKSLREKLDSFSKNLHKHYSKKETVIFPYLERHNITGPPSVMWQVDDEIRGMLKDFAGDLDRALEKKQEALNEIEKNFYTLRDKISEMFSKEEDILTPMLQDTLTEAEWAEIKEQEPEFGVIFSAPPEKGIWQPQEVPDKPEPPVVGEDNTLYLDTGNLSVEEANGILCGLPLDITFVDKNDEVRYFSEGRDKIFNRTKSIIGRKVNNCHPPASINIVEKIVNDFKSGKHSKAEFWLELDGKFIYILFKALRDDNGEYMGTMEIKQDITRLRSLEGERRLLKYEE